MFRRTRSAAVCSLLMLGLLGAPAPAFADADPPADGDNGGAEAEVLGETEGMDGSTTEINGLERASSGEVLLRWTFRNHSEDRIHTSAFRLSQYWNYYSISATQGLTLLDEENQVRYYPLVDSDQRCLCAGGFSDYDFTSFVDPGRRSSYWSTYLLPEDIDTVTVEFPEDFPPVEDVPVS